MSFDFNTFNFTDRDTYILFREQWKNAYAEIILKSRELKNKFKDAARAMSKIELTLARDKWGCLQYTKEWWAAYSEVERIRTQRSDLRQLTNIALTQLQRAKEEAQRQWLASKAG